MFCPRCGEETDGGARYCASCGADLQPHKAADGDKRSLGERIGDAIGRTRRERILSAGTAMAAVIAIVAFFALDTDTDTDRSNETPVLSRADAEAVDAACIAAKQSIAAAAASALESGEADLKAYSATVLRSIVEFRSRVQTLDDAELEALEAALLSAAAEAGELSRVVREEPARAEQQAEAVDEATGEIDAAIAQLGLSGCADVATAPIAPE